MDEVTQKAEDLVVGTIVVDTESVAVTTETEQRKVSATVREEQVAIDGDVDTVQG